MTGEARRRAYLGAMQVVSWVPRVAMPFAAPSRPGVFAAPESVAEPTPAVAPESRVQAAPSAAPERLRPELPRPSQRAEATTAVAAPSEATSESAPALAPPRFSLQLLRAGNCLLLVELPTGEGFQGRDPAYLLLRDLLRAAKLPDSPLQVGDGEPIRWPLLRRGNLDQGPDAARDYVQGVILAEAQQQPHSCLWLIGRAALRFAGEVDENSVNRELNIEGIGLAWALPGLDQLMDEPQRKAQLWQAMRRSMPRWLEAT